MSDVVFKLVADPSGFTGGIAVADAAVVKLNREISDTEKVSKQTFDNAGNGSKKAGDEIVKTTEKTKSLKAQFRELKAQLADATDPKDIERLSKAAGALADQIGDASDAAAVFATDSPFEAVGNGIGSVAQKLRNLDFKGAAAQSNLLLSATKGITLKEGIAGFKDLGKTALNIGKSLLLNPLFLIPALIVLIVSNFNELKNAGGLVGDTFTSIGKAIGIVIDLGKDFLDLINLIDSTKKSLDDVIKSNDELLTRVNARYDNEIAKAKLAGKNVEQLELAKAKAAIHSNNIALMATNERYRLGQIDAKDYAERIKALETSSSKASLDLINLQVSQKEKAASKEKAAREKANSDYLKNQEAFKQALLDLEKRAQQVELSGLTGEAKLKFQRDLSEKEVKILEETLIKKSIAAGKGNKLGAEQEKALSNLKTAIITEYNKGVLNLAVQEANKEAEIQKKKSDTDIQFLELRNTIAVNGIEKTKALEGSTSLEKQIFEQEKNRSLLQLELKFQEDKLKLVLAQIQAEANAKKTALNGELSGLGTDSASEARKKQIANEIIAIEQGAVLTSEAASSAFEKVKSEVTMQVAEIDTTLNKLGGKIDWQAILGVSDEEMAGIKSNLQTLAGEAQKVLSAYLDFQEQSLEKEVAANEKRQSLLDKDIEGLQTKLDAEMAFQAEGLANRVESIQTEMAQKKKAKEKELADEKKLKEEQSKLAKERMQLQQLQQAAALTTAIANIFASTSTSGPVGVAIGYVTIAAMLGAFAYSQGQASAAINKEDSSFAEGGYTGDGGKYEEAGTVHKGEFVNKQETTKKYRTLLEGMHTEDNAKIALGISELLKNTGVSLSDVPLELNKTRSAIREAEYQLNYNSNNGGVEKRLDALNNEFRKSFNQESRTVLSDGRLMIKKGLNTTYIRQKNG